MVSVCWTNSAVHAGEDVECTITFKNMCSSTGFNRVTSQLPSLAFGRDSWNEKSPSFVRQSSTCKSPASTAKSFHPKSGTHRSTLSFDTSLPLKRASEFTVQHKSPKLNQGTYRNTHKRSVSIVSIGNEGVSIDKIHSGFPTVASKRPGRAHGRAISLQVMPYSKNSGPMTSGKHWGPSNLNLMLNVL